MPQIRIEDPTFERLQRHARPLVDTSDTVVNRALDALDQLAGAPVPANGHGTEAERRIDPRQLPSLTHTKLLDASIAGNTVARPNWNLLLEKMLRLAMKRVGTFEKLCQLCPVNMVSGRKQDEGYSYLSDIDVSVQGQDSNSACRTVVTTAQGLGIALEIGFMWRPKKGAAYPGERARIQIAGLSGAASAKQAAAAQSVSA